MTVENPVFQVDHLHKRYGTNLVVNDVSLAKTMLDTAFGNSVITNQFQYTSLISSGFASQSLLTVTAVPEAQTWAMLLAGLGLIGFVKRRKAA